jgi:hypothetical protein
MASCDSGIESEAVSPISQYLDVSSALSSATVTPLYSPEIRNGSSLASSFSDKTQGFFNNSFRPSANYISIASMLDPVLDTDETTKSDHKHLDVNFAELKPIVSKDMPGEARPAAHQAFGRAFASEKAHYNALDIMLNAVTGKGTRLGR